MIKELDSIIVSLKLDLKRMKNEYRDDKYANIDDIVRMCSIFIPYLIVLIDENKVDEQKIQLDIGFNIVHINDKRRITHFSKSDNVICIPSSDTSKILDDLLNSLYDNNEVDLTTSRTSISFVFESVEECIYIFIK